MVSRWRLHCFFSFVSSQAGMVNASGDNLEIALDMEAAGVACRGDLLDAWKSLGKPNKLRYIVVDCGSTTTGTTVHEVDMATGMIDEVHATTSCAWGGTDVNKNILDVIQRAIGRQVSERIDPQMWFTFERECIEESKVGYHDDSNVYFNLTSTLFSKYHCSWRRPGQGRLQIERCGLPQKARRLRRRLGGDGGVLPSANREDRRAHADRPGRRRKSRLYRDGGRLIRMSFAVEADEGCIPNSETPRHPTNLSQRGLS